MGQGIGHGHRTIYEQRVSIAGTFFHDPFQVHITFALESLQAIHTRCKHIVKESGVVAVAVPNDFGASLQKWFKYELYLGDIFLSSEFGGAHWPALVA